MEMDKIRSLLCCRRARPVQTKPIAMAIEWWDSVYMCTRNIMKSGGGQLDMLAIYLLKVHLLSWIIQTSGVRWFEIDVFF